MIDSQFEKLAELPGDNFEEKRKFALEKVDRKTKDKDRIIVPVDFNPNLPNIREVFKKHHKAMIFNAPHLQEVFKSPPMASFRQPPNLRRLLCKAKLHPQDRSVRLTRGTHQNAPGWKKCGKNCKICPYTLPNTREVVGLASGYRHEIKEAVTCSSKNVIYYWKCTKSNCEDFPNCEYIGQTKRQFKDRLSEHRDYPKRDVVTEPSGEHFTKRGHNVSHLKGLILERVKNPDPFVLKAREHLFIRKFDTFHRGLNQEA